MSTKTYLCLVAQALTASDLLCCLCRSNNHFHYQLVHCLLTDLVIITMVTTGATYGGAVGPANSSESSTINPRMFASIHRYGSAEQPTKRGRVENMEDYLNSMNETGNTPRPSPRTS